MTTLFLAFVAGLLTILSPCVLPLAPIVIAGARARGAAGP
jgi:cytochrome c-type biogenesis protein